MPIIKTKELFINELKKYDLSKFNEIIFCGFGEPLTRINDVLEVAKYLKDRTSDSLPSVFKNSSYNTINIENNTGISYDYTYYESRYSNQSGSINEDEIVQKVSFIKSKQI